jgi:hypothetical protein
MPRPPAAQEAFRQTFEYAEEVDELLCQTAREVRASAACPETTIPSAG